MPIKHFTPWHIFQFRSKKSTLMKKFYFSVLITLVGVLSLAQDAKVDIDVGNEGKGSAWGSPLLWIIGAAVFILLLVALLRRRD